MERNVKILSHVNTSKAKRSNIEIQLWTINFHVKIVKWMKTCACFYNSHGIVVLLASSVRRSRHNIYAILIAISQNASQ